MAQQQPWAWICLAAMTLVTNSVIAQAALTPAPMLGQGKDADGRPLPFGIPPHFAPETPLAGPATHHRRPPLPSIRTRRGPDARPPIT